MGAGRESVPPGPPGARGICEPAPMDGAGEGEGESIEPIPAAEAFASPFPPPPPPEPPLPPPRSRKWAWIVVGLGLAVAAALVVFGVFVLGGDDGIDYPDEWDDRVADLADFVEEERGERYDHPVEVEFLTEEEYSERTRSDEAELTAEDEEDLDAAEALFRAFGLAEGDLDLFDSINEISDSGTLAFYDPETDRITVRGTEMTVDLEVTLVHELTHALQDQFADLVEIQEDAADGADDAVRGLIEGDAVLVEQAYVDEELTDEERAQYDDISETQADDALEDLTDVPEALLAFFQAPYAFGPPFVLAVETDREINEAFEDPPASDEQLMDPGRYLADDAPLEVDQPEVDEDAEVLDEGVVGALAWYLTLAERIDPFVALTAVDGWGGDAYVLTGDEDATCIHAAVRTDSDADTDELLAAVQEWAAALPEGMASATLGDDDDTILVDSCDPGGEADLALTGRGADALAIPVTRSYIYADAATVFADDDATCVADTAVRGLSFEQVTDQAGTVFTDGTFDSLVQDAVVSCDVDF